MEPANDHDFVPRIEELLEIGLQLLELLVEHGDVTPNLFGPPVEGLLIYDKAGHMPLGIGIESGKEGLAVSPVERVVPQPHDVDVLVGLAYSESPAMRGVSAAVFRQARPPRVTAALKDGPRLRRPFCTLAKGLPSRPACEKSPP